MKTHVHKKNVHSSFTQNSPKLGTPGWPPTEGKPRSMPAVCPPWSTCCSSGKGAQRWHARQHGWVSGKFPNHLQFVIQIWVLSYLRRESQQTVIPISGMGQWTLWKNFSFWFIGRILSSAIVGFWMWGGRDWDQCFVVAVTAREPQERLLVQSAGKLPTDGVWEYFTCEPEGYSFESHSAGRVSHTYQKTCPWL